MFPITSCFCGRASNRYALSGTCTDTTLQFTNMAVVITNTINTQLLADLSLINLERSLVKGNITKPSTQVIVSTRINGLRLPHAHVQRSLAVPK